MWRIFSDGFGGFTAFYFDSPLDEYALGAGGGFLVSAALVVFMMIVGWFLQVMGAALFLPMAAMMLAAFLFGLLHALSPDNALGPLMVVTPIPLYAWACVCFAMRGATAAAGEGWTSFAGLVIFGLGMVVLCAGLSDEIDPKAWFAVPLVAQFFVWWAAIAVDYSGPLPEQVLRIIFRVLGILAAVGIVLCVIGAFRRSEVDRDRFSAMGLLTALGMGIVPIVAGGLLAEAGPLACVLGTVAAYVALAAVPATMGRHLPPSALGLSYLVLFACYLATYANLSYLPPVDVPNQVALAMVTNPLVSLGGDLLARVADAFAWAGTGVFGVLGNLLMGVFETSLPPFALPELVGCALGYACAMLAMVAAGSLVPARK